MSKFIVNCSSMWKNRKKGVSGLLRVKNDAEFIEACIESCISALDELVISYNDCTDNSEDIINMMKNKYPDKIKVFKYEPHILSTNLTKDEYDAATKLPQNSVNLLSNYYNYVLSKSSYEFVMKIDADQIYFTSYLEELCNAYRGQIKCKIRLKDYFSFIIVILAFLFTKYFVKKKDLYWIKTFFIGYKKVLLKLASKGFSISLSGINVMYYKDNWYVTLGREIKDGKNILCPYNGVGDHLIFKVTPRTKFIPYLCVEYNKIISSKYAIIERLVGYRRAFPFGFMWIHLNGMRKNNYAFQMTNYNKYPKCYIRIEDFIKLKFHDFSFRIPDSMLTVKNRHTFRILHDGDIENIPINIIGCYGYNFKDGLLGKSELNGPKVSVLVPAYNAENYIEEAIKSILLQSYKNIEIIVCDDCSTDKTFDIVSNLAIHYKNIMVVANIKNEGYLKTFNRLLAMAQGQYISFLDADDFLSPYKISKQVIFLENNPSIGVVGCQCASISAKGKTISISKYPLTNNDIMQKMKSELCFCGSSVMIRRDVVLSVGGYREFFVGCVAEDYDWLYRIVERFKCANLDYVGYYYRFHANSLTRKVNFSVKKRHIHEIVRKMAEDREISGSDFLIRNDLNQYKRILNDLNEPYRIDRGLLYRKVIIEYAINKDFKNAKMYFRRLCIIEGFNFRIYILMNFLLYTKQSILVFIKRLTGISHLSSKI